MLLNNTIRLSQRWFPTNRFPNWIRCFTNTPEGIAKLTEMQQTSVSLSALTKTGSGKLLGEYDFSFIDQRVYEAATEQEKVCLQVARFLHREMPVRLAHRYVELENLPHGLAETESIAKVRGWYEESLRDLQSLERSPQTFEEAADGSKFAKTIDQIYERHRPTLVTVAKALLELREITGSAGSKFPDLRETLDDFYIARVGVRMLLGQYLALLKPPPKKSYIGLIDTATSPASIARAAADDAAYICDRECGDAPDVEIEGRTDLVFAYVPSHLYYILFELLKNSMKATYEHHANDDNFGELPKIKIIIADGEENDDVCIKVADEGGGIRRKELPRIWNYLYTTSNPAFALDDCDSISGPFTRETPLSGLGYGLPISRVYARYFGGDLDILSMEGFGTDAFLHLSRIGDEKEPIP